MTLKDSPRLVFNEVWVLTERQRGNVYMEAPGESAESEYDEWASKVRFFTERDMAEAYLKTVAAYSEQNEENFQVVEMPFDSLYFLIPTFMDRSIGDYEAFMKLVWSECESGEFPETYMSVWDPHRTLH